MSAYKTPAAFDDLYFDFTGYAHPGYPKGRTAIAQALSRTLSGGSGANEPGPVVVATATGIYVYDHRDGHALLGGATFRAIPDSGFYEITSVSHVGPAIAYLATMRDCGDPAWQAQLAPLIEHLRAVREVNRVPLDEHWTTRLACPAWVGHEARIRTLVDYACALAGSYLRRLQDDPDRLSPAGVVDGFLAVESEEFPVPFNTVMIGTFALIALKSAFEIHGALQATDLDWRHAKVILHNLAGTNYSAGLTAGTNWVHPTVLAVAGPALAPGRVMITPYAPIPDAVGGPALSDEDFAFLADRVWGQLFARPQVTQRAFSNVADIVVADRPAIPGDYGYTRADQIDHFVMRLKYATSNIAEMQSNTIGFWMSGEAVAKGWDLSRIDIPGLTHGLPDGLDGYPEDAPEIPAS